MALVESQKVNKATIETQDETASQASTLQLLGYIL